MKFIIVFSLFLSNIFANNYGELLFNGNCITCHFKTKNISAPAIKDVKQRYLDAFPKQKDFVEYMSTWAKHPNAKTALMQDAIIKYELMPELGFDKDTLKYITQYIYETKF